jgi:hypothetical protein
MSQQHAPRGPIKAKDDPMAAPDPMAGKCTATNRKGNRCTQPHIPGGTVCRYHGGAAPQVQQKAMERLRALQTPAIDALAWLLTQREYPSAAMSASRDVLDRTEGKAQDNLALNVSGSLEIVERLRSRFGRPAPKHSANMPDAHHRATPA